MVQKIKREEGPPRIQHKPIWLCCWWHNDDDNNNNSNDNIIFPIGILTTRHNAREVVGSRGKEDRYVVLAPHFP